MLANALIKKNQKYQTKGKIGYGSRNYINPFFEKKRKSKNTGLVFDFFEKVKYFILSLIILIISISAFLLFSSLFSINEIEVNGSGRIDKEEIKKIADMQINSNYVKIFSQKNIFIFNTNKFKGELESRYAFNSLTVSKKYPHKLVISFKEKTYAFILNEDNKFYYADQEGSIIEEVSPLEITNKAYLIINNESDQKILNKYISFNKEYINYALNLFALMKKNEDQFKISQIIVDNDLKTIKVALENGPKVFFNTEKDAVEQISKLLIIKLEKIKNDFAKKEYIDLRYGDSVYYR